ncbi:hypothetical protein JMG10_19890 [Nostoc ellipsosporum NOK]|nr:hypothetical protein [Nostoc ellipsosporum NOK]
MEPSDQKERKSKPNPHTKLKLFADSDGYCHNANLFLTIGVAEFHIAEIAVILTINHNAELRLNK